jgi:hypothetical protein
MIHANNFYLEQVAKRIRETCNSEFGLNSTVGSEASGSPLSFSLNRIKEGNVCVHPINGDIIVVDSEVVKV